MIKITNLNKSYGDKKVLEDLNCTIKTGSIYGLIGANGAGKSTLLRIIMGIFQKNSGSIEIDGKEIMDDEEFKQKLVYVPDDLFFFKGYTIDDMVIFYSKLYKNFDKEFAFKMFDKLKLNRKQKIQTFSKGMKRQTALVCALSTNADYMFFDETFDGIDPVIRNFMKKVIAEQMEKKETTIIPFRRPIKWSILSASAGTGEFLDYENFEKTRLENIYTCHDVGTLAKIVSIVAIFINSEVRLSGDIYDSKWNERGDYSVRFPVELSVINNLPEYIASQNSDYDEDNCCKTITNQMVVKRKVKN